MSLHYVYNLFYVTLGMYLMLCGIYTVAYRYDISIIHLAIGTYSLDGQNKQHWLLIIEGHMLHKGDSMFQLFILNNSFFLTFVTHGCCSINVPASFLHVNVS